MDGRILLDMRERMVHRGPDDGGVHLDGPLGIAVRRLSVIDIVGGHQPLASEGNRVWTGHNGEIYNFRELRQELEASGHVFRTRSDTEVIVHAYEQWGFDALRRLNGMFGLAIWDARQKELVLARDPFGVKPLYIWDDGTTLVFASELRSLLAHPLVPCEVDPAAVSEFLTLGYVPSPGTALQGITKVVPGHGLVVRRGGTAEVRRFYRPSTESLPPDEREVVEELRRRIRKAVMRQLVSDVPIAAMLSGGIDSTTIATIMAEAAPSSIATYTVGFDGHLGLNELEEARETASWLGSDHHEIVLSSHDFMELLPRVVRHLEEPIANPSAVPFLALSELASQSVKVALSGQGADESFAGYDRYVAERYGGIYRAVPRVIRERLIAPAVARLPRNEQLKRAVRSCGVSDVRERMQRVRSVVDEPALVALLRSHQAPMSDAHAVWEDDVSDRPALDRMLYVDARTSLADNLLLFGDKIGMAASLEVRVPYLDHDLMAFTESIPASRKVVGRNGKRIFKRAVSPWIPREVVNRKKVGFATPVDSWLRSDLRPLLEERLLGPGSACGAYLRAEGVRRLVSEHESGRHDHKRILFSLLVLSYWQEEIVGARRPLESVA